MNTEVHHGAGEVRICGFRSAELDVTERCLFSYHSYFSRLASS